MSEKTIRACLPFFHRYTPWKISGSLVRSRDRAEVGLVQSRHCVKCGFVKIHRQEWA